MTNDLKLPSCRKDEMARTKAAMAEGEERAKLAIEEGEARAQGVIARADARLNELLAAHYERMKKLANHKPTMARSKFPSALEHSVTERIERCFPTQANLNLFRKEISILAYYKAEQRGFGQGHETDDWLEAERELLAASPFTNPIPP
jgi:regulator of protease activity HflC (stomatin/prohibitin superfamily)